MRSRDVLNDQKVCEILRLLAETACTEEEIARMFDVSQPTISRIRTRKIWKHVSC